MKMRVKSGIVLAVALVAGATFGVLVSAADPFDGREHDDRPEPTGPESVVPIEGGEPPYRGPLGDFLVAPGEGADYPCRTVKGSSGNPQQSELASPVFTEHAVAASCADGTVVAVTDYGHEVVGKRYFVGSARLPYDAPLERLTLLTIGGKPAIAQLPMAENPFTLRLAIIQRPATSDEPGILVWIDNTELSLEAAADLAEQMMEVRS